MLSKSFIWLIVAIIMLFLNGCGSKSTATGYKYIDIQECKIPISNKFNLIEKPSKYEYHFTYIDNSKLVDNLYQFSVFNRKKNDYKHIIENINDTDDYKITKQYKVKNFDIIEIESQGIQKIYHIYNIFTKNSVIQYSNSTKNEINKLIDYCINTKK